MISAPGNKFLVVAAALCFSAVALVFGGIIAEKRTRIRYFEKKYAAAVSVVNENNQRVNNEK